MNVLLLRANPRKTGYTQRIAELFRAGLSQTDARVRDVDVTALSVTPCDGCYHCWLVTPGQCVHSDDMGAQLEWILAADVIVCATPIYFYSMSAPLKAYFERLFPLFEPKIVPSRRGLTRNSARYPARWTGKKLITLVTGAFREPEGYRPTNEIFQLIADSLDLELTGQLTRPESYLLDYALSKPKTLKAIEAAFIQAGREAGTAGRLSPETMQAAALPLAPDLDRFRSYSNIYWSLAHELGEAGMLPAEVQKQVACDVRILMQEMARFFDAKAAARIHAVLQFEFTDQNRIYRLQIQGGHCELAEGGIPKPTLLIRCAASVWAGIFTRQVNAISALRSGQLTLTGDKSLFARFDRLFPPPAT
jgi:multimeric flavodoxin WrbA/putative sterol carrier protein